MPVTLIEKIVPRTVLFLDPNNPRFERSSKSRQVPLNRITEPAVQDDAYIKITEDRFGVQELRDSIGVLGFQPIDRLAVLELPEGEKYVVIEGNRRLGAIRMLIDEIMKGERDSLRDDIAKSIEEIPVLIISGGTETERLHKARVIQGLRHVSGIRRFGPYQQAELVNLMLSDGMEAEEISESLGTQIGEVLRLRRAYRAIEQLLKDTEYGAKVKPADVYSYFEEAIKKPKIREWLNWNRETEIFENESTVHQFYDWILGFQQDDTEYPPKITDAKQIRRLPDLMQNHLRFEEFCNQPAMTLDDAVALLRSVPPTYNWRDVIQENLTTIQQLPSLALVNDAALVQPLVEELRSACDKLLMLISAAQAANDSA